MAARKGLNTVSAYEAKTHLSALLKRVKAGQEFTVTKRGVPVAKLVPIKREASAQERAAAVRRIQRLASGLSLNGLRVRDLIREGSR